MSKYDTLWEWIKGSGEESLCLSFDELERLAGAALDHSFLTCKSELLLYGYTVEKISIKKRTVLFHKTKS